MEPISFRSYALLKDKETFFEEGTIDVGDEQILRFTPSGLQNLISAYAVAELDSCKQTEEELDLKVSNALFQPYLHQEIIREYIMGLFIVENLFNREDFLEMLNRDFRRHHMFSIQEVYEFAFLHIIDRINLQRLPELGLYFLNELKGRLLNISGKDLNLFRKQFQRSRKSDVDFVTARIKKLDPREWEGYSYPEIDMAVHLTRFLLADDYDYLKYAIGVGVGIQRNPKIMQSRLTTIINLSEKIVKGPDRGLKQILKIKRR